MNIFDGIFHRENNVTEVLNNLMYYKPFRKAFFDFLDLDIKDTKSVTIETQVELQKDKKKFGIIDMLIKDDDKEYLIEIKTNKWTPLSEHQKREDYQEYINQNDNIEGRLIYLLPKNYRYKEDITGEKKYWGDFSKAIKAKGLDKLNPFIEHFVKAINQESVYRLSACEQDLIFRKGEVSMESKSIPGIVKKLQGIVDNIRENVVCRNGKINKYSNSEYFGYKCEFEGILFWFGIDYDVWEENGCPIVIWVDNNDKINTKLSEFHFVDYGEVAKIYCFGENDLSREDVVAVISDKINEVLSKVLNNQ